MILSYNFLTIIHSISTNFTSTSKPNKLVDECDSQSLSEANTESITSIGLIPAESNDVLSEIETETSDSPNVSQRGEKKLFNFEREFKQYIEVFHVTGSDKRKEKNVWCITCIEFPNVVKLNCDNRKPSSMNCNI